MRYIFSHDGLNMGKSPNDLKKMSLKLVCFDIIVIELSDCASGMKEMYHHSKSVGILY